MTGRHTHIVHSGLVRSSVVLEAARTGAHGRQVLSPAQGAARLAGGFLQAIDRETLKDVLHEVLRDETIDIGELNAIRDLPGMVRASASTLQSVWLAGIDLSVSESSDSNQRQADLACLEAAVCERLPASMRRPRDLADLAAERLEFAPKVLGPLTLLGIPDFDPVWRSLLSKLAEVVPVRWQLGHFSAPQWLAGTKIEVAHDAPLAPEISRVACANPRHEALEAIRWARELIAGGTACPEEIAIAAPATEEWDNHLATISADANLPLAFAMGRPALAMRDGQAAAALAEILLNGLSQNRMRRLLSLTHGMTAVTDQIPPNWQRILPKNAPLLQADRWQQLLANISEWPDDKNFGAAFSALIEVLDRGLDAADEIGEALLAGRASAIWRRALQEGPARALDVSCLLPWTFSFPSALDSAISPMTYPRN